MEPGIPTRRAAVLPLAFLLLWAAVGCGPTDRPARPPNVVILLADDLGWNDVSYHGGPIPTPRIDRFVGDSMELDRFYVAPYCTPTRAGLLTGRYPHRVGLPYISDIPSRTFRTLPATELVLPELLGSAGYGGRALIGKWSLGQRKHGELPLDQGFTHFYGALGGMVGYFDHLAHDGDLDWYRGRSLSLDAGYATDLIGDESVDFIRRMSDEPFLLYVAFTAPHIPLQAPSKGDEVAERSADPAAARRLFPGSDEVNAEIYAAMVASLDVAVGRILDALDEAGHRNDTIVLFLSDNGALGRRGAGDNRPLRGEKNTLFEGGIRVPAAIRWPGVVPAGRSEALVSYLDVVPTLLAAAGQAPPTGERFDGIDFVPLLTAQRDAPDRLLYFGPETGVTQRWKLHGGELFDLEADPNESTDVGSRYPQVLEDLERRLRAVR